MTLVELLVVTAIIALLLALLLPAVQSARESGRRLQCGNNARQLALGCVSHVEQFGLFPSGGWGYNNTGDPDMGIDDKQTGGWLYNVLPFIEQTALHDLCVGLTGGPKSVAGRQVFETVVPGFNCPTRRPATTYPYTGGSQLAFYSGVTWVPRVAGRADYAGCGGVDWGTASHPFPATGNTAWTEADWQANAGGYPAAWSGSPFPGVIRCRGRVRPAHVRDGLSATLLLGERYMNPDTYGTGTPYDDDQGWAIGYDWDTVRFTKLPPIQDTPGVFYGSTALRNCTFGSAHAGSFIMATCDGAVQTIGYDVNATVFMYLGGRDDKQQAAVP